MKKIFISQPMRGKTPEEILEVRENNIKRIKEIIDEEFEIIDSYIHDEVTAKSIPVWCLGKSIELLSEADIAYFAKDWDKFRGCKLEHKICEEYGIKIIYEESKTVMISQPMNRVSAKKIEETRNRAKKYLEEKGYTFVNTKFTDEWYSPENLELRDVKQKPLSFFAKSIENMTKCDSVYFCKGFQNYRGCKLEHQVAKAYGLEVLYEEKTVTFKEAWNALLNGKCIKLPEWKGYWKWKKNTIMMYCKDGRVLDIRETDDPKFTIGNIAEDRWIILDYDYEIRR